jgi:UDP-2,3-diacylglucosamine pyrophosphatase LpxH
MQTRKYYPTMVLSDIHIGSEFSKIEEVTDFLKSINCDKLILNGDIIDGWQLQKSGKNVRDKKYTELLKVIMAMQDNFGTEVIYVRGNHDDFLDSFIPFRIANISFVKEYYHESFGQRYYVVHGDIFDAVTSRMRWLSKLGDIGYTLLLIINRIYNKYRVKKGKPYYSFSQSVKQKFKSAVSYISDFEEELVNLARIKHCDGIICGHIHQPADTWYGDIRYLNSGDWVETLSALAEKPDGEWEIILYHEFKADKDALPETKKIRIAS